MTYVLCNHIRLRDWLALLLSKWPKSVWLSNTSPASSIRRTAACRVEFSGLGIRTEYTVLRLPVQARHVKGRRLRRGSVLHPGPELLEQARRGAAAAAKAVP